MAVEKFLQFSIYYKYPLHEWHDSEKNEIYITMNFIQIIFKWRLVVAGTINVYPTD